MASDRHQARRSRLISAVKKAQLDLLIVSHPPNVTYLTGFTGDASCLLIGPKKTVMVSDSRFETQLADECPGLSVEIRTAKTQSADFLAAILKKSGFSRIGFESAYTTVTTRDDLAEKTAGVTLTPAAGLVEELRQVKDSEEIAAIRSAIFLAERGYAVLRSLLLPEMTEREAAHELEHAMRRFGALRAAFEPIIGVGPQSALPHYRAGLRQLGEAPFVLIDWGAVEPGGYHSDLTRVIATSKIPPKLDKLHRVVMNARQAALDAIRPGVACQQVDAAARKVIEDAGFGKYFGHGLGHGIGLEIHESSRFSPLSKDVLQPGMVLTVEPGIYLPGFGGVRLEDDILVTRDGYEVMSSVPLEL
ncbi:MAG TPA: Xaa-Pro peptidase family protein [Planctomycetaceae bacterium]|nr:Xaa-Pro peptidase family protein [Planctomycetaceae bacterium]